MNAPPPVRAHGVLAPPAPVAPAWCLPPSALRPDARRADVWLVRVRDDAAARAALRRVVARSLGLASADVAMGRTAAGRPVVASPRGAGVHVSLAHTHGLALVALRGAHAIGVDIERVRPCVDYDGVAAAAWPPAWQAAWRDAPRHDDAAFFAMWARHEALVKACGLGLGAPDPLAGAAAFEVRGLPAPRGCAAAVASARGDWRVACWRDPALDLT